MCYKCDFLGSGNNCGIFKQASEQNSNEFRSTCGSKDIAIRFVKNS